MSIAIDEDLVKRLDELKVQRASTRGCITRIRTLVNSKADTLTATELDCRLGILESYWKALLSHQTAIERLSPDDMNNNVVRGELEDLYCEVKGKILLLLPSKGRLSFSEGNTSIVAPIMHKAKLPQLKLPQFSGKYSDYPNFIATFNKLVHDDPDKSITEKYSHLLSCLSGAALRSIESLGKSAITYTQALDKLKERFDNKCLIFQEHISELFELPKVAKASADQLRYLVDNTSAHLSALRALGTDTDILNSIVIHLTNSKLDSESQARWEESIDYSKFLSWQSCEQVLSRRCQLLEGREKKPTEHSSHQRGKPIKQQYNRAPMALKITSVNCSLCSEPTHTIGNCPKFAQLSVLERFETAKRLSLCINCLSKEHSLRDCRSGKCRVCHRSHHTQLHRYSRIQNSTSHLCPVGAASKGEAPIASPPNPPSTLCSGIQDVNPGETKGHVFLATAVVQIKDKFGCYHPARALLDSASQLNFITADLAHKLSLKRRRINAAISGIGDVTAKVFHEVCSIVKSRINDFQSELNMWILPGITGLQPEMEIDVQPWNMPRNLDLADSNLYKLQRVDLLIGADKFFQLLSIGQIKLGTNLPTLQKTLFGWIVCGTYNTPPVVAQICNIVSSSNTEYVEDTLNSIVEKFWEIECLEPKRIKHTEEQLICEDFFQETVRRAEDGRFVIRLPLKAPISALGESYEIAKRRFMMLEWRLLKNPELKQEYAAFLEDYYNLDHMELVPDTSPSSGRYYMPHSCVLRPESSSTKLRVVFDASCRTSSQISLNDILMVGPTVQNDLFSILFRFRCWKFALTADVSKMYRQILVHPEDRELQCILWRDPGTGNLQTFRLKTVTYGTVSAPYLVTRCLNFLADENSESYPQASNVIKHEFYVDDLLTGADSEAEITQLRDDIQHILASGHFELRKWYSNVRSLLIGITESAREKLIMLHDSAVIRTLGIAWEPTADEFLYSYKLTDRKALRITKRTILSDFAKLFDPLGLINPIVVKGKIFMQELWLLNLSWDESLPLEFSTRWESYLDDLKNIHTIRVPRLVLSKSNSEYIEMHGFCDASNRAYGCCIYCRCIDNDGVISIHLHSAKSKVAPTKTVRTLPCLELCGAELLAQIVEKTGTLFKKPVHCTYLWTDSQVVLGWLSSHASSWKPFVTNRVSTIQEKTKGASWSYVPSKLNPADIVSRGATTKELKESCWFNGPDFLKEMPEFWPIKQMKLAELPEKRKVKTILTSTIQSSFVDSIYKWSSFTKTRRIFAFILRFIHNIRQRQQREEIITGDLTASELEAATTSIVRIIQQCEFVEELALLKKDKSADLKKSFQALTPFIDEAGLLRVGGRLTNANLPYATKHPFLLSKANPFVKSYFTHLHQRSFQAGPGALVALSRQHFWIVNARHCARKIVRECIHCFRYKPKLMK